MRRWELPALLVLNIPEPSLVGVIGRCLFQVAQVFQK